MFNTMHERECGYVNCTYACEHLCVCVCVCVKLKQNKEILFFFFFVLNGKLSYSLDVNEKAFKVNRK